jgi:hypothetical protein
VIYEMGQKRMEIEIISMQMKNFTNEVTRLEFNQQNFKRDFIMIKK